MIQNIVQARLVVKNGPSSEWKEKNPVLLSGELGYEKDTKILKIGDGKTPWNALAPVHAEAVLNTPASQTQLGGVLSSLEQNKIFVEEDGTMSLNSVSTSLLYVPEEDELVISGGEAGE